MRSVGAVLEFLKIACRKKEEERVVEKDTDKTEIGKNKTLKHGERIAQKRHHYSRDMSGMNLEIYIHVGEVLHR